MAAPPCTCMTKTPEVRFHDPECEYRKAIEESSARYNYADHAFELYRRELRKKAKRYIRGD